MILAILLILVILLILKTPKISWTISFTKFAQFSFKLVTALVQLGCIVCEFSACVEY